jgi:protocatechuate 3,4-dioxygenase beta subunit
MKWARIIFLALMFLLAALLSADAPEKALTGQVLTADGKPAGGAFVLVAGYDPAERESVVAQTTAGADGKFSLTAREFDPKTGDQLVAEIPNVGFAKPLHTSDNPAEPMRLSPMTPLHLTFLAPDGTPIAGMVVRPSMVRWVQGSSSLFGPFLHFPKAVAQRWEKRTGPDGSVDFTGFPSNSVVRFDADDDRFAQLSLQDDVQMTGDKIVNKTIQCVTAVEASGTLTYSDTGKPAAGMIIGAQGYDYGPMGGGESVTDAAGHFEIKRLTPGKYVVELDGRPEPKDWCAAAALVDLEQNSVNDIKLSLVHGGIVTGKVRDAVDGKGLPGQFVGLHGPAHPNVAAEIQSDTTDSNGTFKMRVPPGSQHVYISTQAPPGYMLPPPPPTSFHAIGGDFPTQTHFDVDVKEGETVTVNFDLPRDTSPTIQGRVVDSDGNPVAGASVEYKEPPTTGKAMRFSPFGLSVQTDATGRFKVRAAAGTILRARFKEMATESPVKASDPAGFYTLKIEPHMSFTLLARAVDGNGAPVPNATFELLSDAINLGETRNANSDGTVTIDSLAVDTTWRIIASAPGYGREPGAVPAPAAPVPPALTRHSEVTVVLPAAGMTISGVVVDQKGNPASGITVSIQGAETGQVDTKTDASGQFTFKVVDGASGWLMLHDANGKTMRRPIQMAHAGETDIKLVMPGLTTQP